ncbi:MAG: hypothetical protein ACR2NO_00990 [Chloroflexota bacterium]
MREAATSVAEGAEVAEPAGVEGRWRRGALVALLVTAPAWALALHPHLDVWALFDGKAHLLAALTGAAASAFFWLPAMLETPLARSR